MNEFERRVVDFTGGNLTGLGIETVQVNLGFRCNQRCAHCHVGGSPDATSAMDWTTMAKVLDVCRRVRPQVVDLTGGSPEMNPSFRPFVEALRSEGHPVKSRTNLTVFFEPGLEDAPEFLRRNAVMLVASMPCYLEENVRAQRGGGVYEKSIRALQRLNALGYARDARLTLDLVYNPGGPFLPPNQAELEADYRRELLARFGIVFTRLLTITNMPIGRFKANLGGEGAEAGYVKMLKEAFNPATVEGLMCRRQVSIGWDGTLYDCDFNLALRMPVDHGAPDHVSRFDESRTAQRRIVTGEHCFGCTAGEGSSCRGALA